MAFTDKSCSSPLQPKEKKKSKDPLTWSLELNINKVYKPPKAGWTVQLIVDAYCSLLKFTTKKIQDIVLRQTVPHISTLTVWKFRRLAVQNLPRQTVLHISTLTVWKFRRLTVQNLPRQTVPHISTLTVRKFRRLAVQNLPRQNRGQIFSRHCRKFDLRCVKTISV